MYLFSSTRFLHIYSCTSLIEIIKSIFGPCKPSLSNPRIVAAGLVSNLCIIISLQRKAILDIIACRPRNDNFIQLFIDVRLSPSTCSYYQPTCSYYHQSSSSSLLMEITDLLAFLLSVLSKISCIQTILFSLQILEQATYE